MYISEEQASNIIRAVEHYGAYLKATNRDDRPQLLPAVRRLTAVAAFQKTTAETMWGMYGGIAVSALLALLFRVRIGIASPSASARSISRRVRSSRVTTRA